MTETIFAAKFSRVEKKKSERELELVGKQTSFDAKDGPYEDRKTDGILCSCVCVENHWKNYHKISQ